jgi:phosphate starvation-inducible membrane PsiE
MAAGAPLPSRARAKRLYRDITVLARIAVLQKEQDAIHIFYEADAILLLAIAAFIVKDRPRNLVL